MAGHHAERALNVVFLTYSYSPAVGGVQRAVAGLAAELGRRGHRVLVVTHAPLPLRRPFRFTRIDGVPVLRLNIPPQCEPELGARIAAALKNALNLGVLLPLAAWMRTDVVSAHFVNMDTLYAGRVARVLGIPWVLTLHGSDVMRWGWHTPARTGYLTRALSAANAVTAVARGLIDEAERYLPGVGDKAEAIPNGVDVAALRALAAAAPRPPGAPYVVFVGRLSEEKQVDQIVRAFHELVSHHPDPLELHIVGAGKCAASLRAEAAAGPAAPRIRFFGERTAADTATHIAGAALLVLASRSEGCPFVVLEALALGTPVLGPDIPALRELGPAIAMYPSGDVAALARGMRELAAAPHRHGVAIDAAHELRAIADRYLGVFARTSTRRGRHDGAMFWFTRKKLSGS